MSKPQQSDARPPQQKPNGVEGEGNYTGARRYNEHVKKHVESADTEQLGEEAKRALEGDERVELEEAERRAKRGPTPS